MKNTIKNLKRDAEIRLTLDVEASQSFEFLSDQLHGVRRAFSTLSDVMVEEVDLMRADSSSAHTDLETRLSQLAKGHKAALAELTLLHSQVDSSTQELFVRVSSLEERVDDMGQDVMLLAQEVAKGTSSQHLLQLEVVELRAALEQEARERRRAQEAHETQLADLSHRLEAHASQTHETIGALDADLGNLRHHASSQLGSHAGGPS